MQALLCLFLGEYKRNDQIRSKAKILRIVANKPAATEIAITEYFSLWKNYFCTTA